MLLTILRRPERAARLPFDLISTDIMEGAALAAVAGAIEHAALPVSNLGLLIEHFRGTSHEEIIAALAGQIESDAGDEGEQEAVFTDAIERLRTRSLSRQIDALNVKARTGTLSPEELRSLAALLASKSA